MGLSTRISKSICSSAPIRSRADFAPHRSAAWLLLSICLVAPAQSAMTYHQQIAPILSEYCAPCHRPGQAGPFSLLTYDDARKHATQIAAVTRRRYMPPWLPQSGYGQFANERRLSAAQIQSIEAWVHDGAPEGTPSGKPTAEAPPADWLRGPPDLVIHAPKPFQLPPDGPDRFWNFILSPAIGRSRFVRAVEIRPGNPRLVHHA